jgi:hypothetical protein
MSFVRDSPTTLPNFALKEPSWISFSRLNAQVGAFRPASTRSIETPKPSVKTVEAVDLTHFKNFKTKNLTKWNKKRLTMGVNLLLIQQLGQK